MRNDKKKAGDAENEKQSRVFPDRTRYCNCYFSNRVGRVHQCDGIFKHGKFIEMRFED